MSVNYPLKRFPDAEDPASHTPLYTEEAKEHGAGAFCWMFNNDVRYLVYRHPDVFFNTTCGTSVHSVPVEHVEYGPHWDWDGNEDNPTLNPSISIKTMINWAEPYDWVEIFHGWIKGDYMESLLCES